MTRLSCHRFRSNQVRLALSLLAYNLGNLWRRLALPKRIENWSLTSLQQRLVKTGGRLVKHARYYWLLLAEGHLTRRRFGALLASWLEPVHISCLALTPQLKCNIDKSTLGVHQTATITLRGPVSPGVTRVQILASDGRTNHSQTAVLISGTTKRSSPHVRLPKANPH